MVQAQPPEDGAPPRVTIAIAVYNQAHFLADALRSALAQDRPADEIIVVDDGSEDNPELVVRDFPGVMLIRQDNGGLSAARNTALERAAGDLILFLDSDDMLSPDALSTALACRRAHPDAALVYGGHRRVDVSGAPLGPAQFAPTGADAHADLLRGNLIGMHATVLYDRAKLLADGGFDTGLRKCEDYDVYLRLSRIHPVAHHPAIVADYRIHGSNMSADSRVMLDWVEKVRARHRPAAGEAARWEAAWREGARVWRDYYAAEILEKAANADGITKGRAFLMATAIAPGMTGRTFRSRLRRRLGSALPAGVKYRLKRLAGRPAAPPLGKVRLGDLDRVSPISPDFGFDRGTPVDRHYIERFLDERRADVRGRVLEIGDASYSRRYGSGITQQDVLHIDPDAPGATIVGDLAQPGVLPEASFDCMIITQTLHLIFDMRAAIRQMHDSLKPGGVLLLTVPGITNIDCGDWHDTWFWSLTKNSATRLFSEVFGDEAVQVAAHGNVYAATCFIQGMALEEVDRAKLEHVDRSYPVVVTVRAQRSLA